MQQNRAMSMPSKQDNYIKTALRLPRDLHSEIKSAAEAAGHSMNAEIISRLSAAPTGITLHDIALQTAEVKAMISEIIDTIGSRN